ncbi:hypothetical protein A9W97_17695 [Mycobacterium gordonae]|nr:hypothetical protein A9W97_17695 [Mycobacterium gordonae]
MWPGLGASGGDDVFVDENHGYAMWDAAYVLGALSATHRREFEAHIAECSTCRDAVGEVSGMPALLSQLDHNEVATITASGQMRRVSEMSPELLASSLATVRRHRSSRFARIAAVLAAVMLGICVMIGVQGQLVTSPSSIATESELPMVQVGTTLLASTVSLTSQHWGTYIALKFVCMAPVDAQHDTVAMVVTARDGSQTRLATWVAIPGNTATPAGSIALPVDQIATVRVVLAGNGQVMLERSVQS